MFFEESGDVKRNPNDGNDIKAMEYSTIKVPYEILNKKYRSSQKTIDREVSHMNGTVSELKRSNTLDQANRALDDVVNRLKVIKRKADKSIFEEQEPALLTKRRLEHLKGGLSEDLARLNVWKNTRLDRLLVDHMLRSGYYETAKKLTQAAEIRDLTNLDVFLVYKDVEDSLAARNIGPCLEWCHENKSKLRKIKSTLEYKLRQQEFIELVRQKRLLEAIHYSRKHLCSAPNNKDLEVIMALLAYPDTTTIEPYRSLFSETRWQSLINDFKKDTYELFHLSPCSVFAITLQAGLSALKTPHCYRRSGARETECPICNPVLNELAKNLPFPHCSQSKLICSISGQPLNENNPPLVLPNGHVYGQLSLKAMAKKNGGQIVCPKTLVGYNIQEAQKVYIM